MNHFTSLRSIARNLFHTKFRKPESNYAIYGSEKIELRMLSSESGTKGGMRDLRPLKGA